MEAFIITFRETLEAVVILSIILSIIQLFNNPLYKIYIFIGAFLGIIGSFLFAYIFSAFGDGFSGVNEKIYEGVLMIGSAILITHMVFWMKGQSLVLHDNIKQYVLTNISKQTLYMLGVLSFFSVVREGIETVIFFQALGVQNGNGLSLLWGGAGIFAAVIVAIILNKYMKHISLPKFLKYTGILLIFIAAGLLTHGISEFQGASLLPSFINPLFDISGFLSEKNGFGSFLKSLFGYNANPSLLAVIGYIIFLALSLTLYSKSKK